MNWSEILFAAGIAVVAEPGDDAVPLTGDRLSPRRQFRVGRRRLWPLLRRPACRVAPALPQA